MMSTKQRKHIHEVLSKLKKYKGGSFPVLSVYLSNLHSQSGKKLSEKFQKLIKKSLTAVDAKELASEIDTIDGYLWNTYDSKKHLSGIAFFAAQNMWEIINYDHSIPPVCRVSHAPYILPLQKELQKDARYLFVIADREKADLLTFYQGGLESHKEIINPGVPQKVKSNKENYYARNNIILRHIQNHLHRHLQKISTEVNAFINKKPIQTVFIGGHKPLFHDIKKHLNKNLQKKLEGQFTTELNIPYSQLVQHAEAELEKYVTR